MRRQPAFSLSYAHQIMRPGMQSAFLPTAGIPKVMQDLIDRIGATAAGAPSLGGRLEAIKTLLDAESDSAGLTNH